MGPIKQLALVPLIALVGCASTAYRPPNLGAPRGEAHGQKAQTAYKPAHGKAEHAGFYAASGCGVERWAVKTMTDPGANQVNLTPQTSSIADIVSIAPPVSPTDRVGPFETSTFRISATLRLAKREQDGDYHLGLEDAAGNQMIAESPDPACASGSLVLKQIEAARSALDARFPELQAGQKVEPGLAITLTGIGFADRIHGQAYVARNGFELHPLLAVSFP